MKIHEKKVVTCEEMKQLEQAADRAGLSYYEMMENAGTGAAEASLESYERKKGNEPRAALVFSGKGNNGGDGLVIARYFLEKGIDTAVILTDGTPVTEDSLTNYNLIRERAAFYDLKSIPFTVNPESTIIIDAVYGTGFHGSLRENGKIFVETVNSLREKGAFVASVDIPSGLAGNMKKDESADSNSCIHADLTATFHAAKPVHENEDAVKYCGEIRVIDIGIADALEGKEIGK